MKKIRETVFTIEILSAEPLHFDEIFHGKFQKLQNYLKAILILQMPSNVGYPNKLLKNPLSFLQFTRKAQKAIFWSKMHFFVKFVIFAYKLLSFRILHLAYPKHVGTPIFGTIVDLSLR